MLLLATLAWAVDAAQARNGPEKQEPDPDVANPAVPAPYVWSIEPIKPSSLMLNIHPDWAAFGIETAVRVHRNVWITTFVEIDKGHLHQDFRKPGKDFLVSHSYTAWMTTARTYVKPDARSSGFFDGGLALQWLWQQHLDGGDDQLRSNTGMTVAPVLLGGYEVFLGKSNAFFKVRGGGGWNAHRQGTIRGTLDLAEYEENKRGYYSPYTHLTEVIYQPFFYIGDVAFGFKFGRRKG